MKKTGKERIQRIINPAVLKILETERKKNYQLDIKGERIKKNEQAIYVANHYCELDIPTTLEVIGKHVFVLISHEDKYNEMKEEKGGKILTNLNGAVWIDRADKEDRKRSFEEMKKHLEKGHSVLIYPEAIWNISPNQLMLPIHKGAVELSMSTNVPIRPIISIYNQDTIVSKIGEKYHPQNIPLDTKKADEDILRNVMAIEQTKHLRDIMATDMYELIEENGRIQSREELQDLEADYNRYYKAPKLSMQVEDFMEYQDQFMLKLPNTDAPEEVFSYLSSIKTNNTKTAFLRDEQNKHGRANYKKLVRKMEQK